MQVTPPPRVRLAAAVLAALVSVRVLPQSQLQVGYAVQTADPGSALPVATALFTYRTPAGVLVSQAAVAAAEPSLSGTILVDQGESQTGVALANGSASEATAVLTLRDQAGRERARATLTLGAGRHVARYVSELFPDAPVRFLGSVTFESDRRIAAVTLREGRNARGEPLYATLPVIRPGGPDGAAGRVFPHLAVGGGYGTRILLVNTTGQALGGRLRLTASSGASLRVLHDGAADSEIPYQIEALGVFRADLDGTAGLEVGYAVVEPDPGSAAPDGCTLFRFTSEGAPVTEAAVQAAAPTRRARVFADSAGTYTGVALANPDNPASAVDFTLLDRSGGFLDRTSRTLPAGGHLAVFVHELFPELPEGFTGLVEVASSRPISATTLKLTLNERGDQVLTTLPVADLEQVPAAASAIFPQVAIGAGFSTRLIFINADTGSAASGALAFVQSDGAAMVLSMGGRTASRFAYGVRAGGGRQFLPGDTAVVASIAVVDASGGDTAELTVNVGRSLRPTLVVLDTTGKARDDFDLRYATLDDDVATVDASGLVRGIKAGFSTLAISAGSVVTVVTVTVVGVQAFPSGFAVNGVASDLALRLYLSSTESHVVLLASSLAARPERYAGVAQSPGLKDDERLKALFSSPAFLALNRASGALYVADGGNHAIRVIEAGSGGRVSTLTGSGAPGSRDGDLAVAAFNRPQGLVLDPRGNLWVADSGNHTIRRINLAARTVETVAGQAGISGADDGAGSRARFSSPAGLALEVESLAAQLERERLGNPPLPVAILVADAGNGLVRRVSEDGLVETLRTAPATTPAGPSGFGRLAAGGAALRFAAPSGIAMDPFGNLHVAESKTGAVRTVLEEGGVVAAVQAGTFVRPGGLAVTEGGALVATDSGGAREVRYGEPEITRVVPDSITYHDSKRITVSGRNFAPGTRVVVGRSLVGRVEVRDTRTLVFTVPPLPSGRTTLTVQSRGGLAQTSFLVEPIAPGGLPAGSITTVAGGSTFAGDGASATAAAIGSPKQIALDQAGNLYECDPEHHRVRRVSAATGVITTVAGSGDQAFAGDGGPATAASLSAPRGVAIDAQGNVFIADTFNNRIRRVDAVTGTIDTLAGTGEGAFGGDGGPAERAKLFHPIGLALDGRGGLYVADTDNFRVRRIDLATRGIGTVAGNGVNGFAGDQGPAVAARLGMPYGLVVDAAGNLFIADTANDRVRRVDARSGTIATVVGSGGHGFAGDGDQARLAALNLPRALALDASGNLFIADTANHRVRKVDAATGVIATLAGNGQAAYSGDREPAIGAGLWSPEGLAIEPSGDVFIADSRNHRIRRVAIRTGTIATVAGNGELSFVGDGGLASAAALDGPRGFAIDPAGAVLVADTGNNRIRRVDPQTGRITTLAGNGDAEFSGDSGAATAAGLNRPEGVALDAAGDLFVADTENARVRRVDVRLGTISTVAGTGRAAFSGDGGPATAAALSQPKAVARDGSGNLFIADTGNDRVRRVALGTGIITTFAGNGSRGFSGDGGPAASAALHQPEGLWLDGSTALFVADAGNHRVRRIDLASGVITTVAGSGQGGFSGDGGPALAAQLAGPRGVALDAAGNILIADTFNHSVRRVDPSGLIATIAGSGREGYGGDGGPATAARMSIVRAITVDASGNLWIADKLNNRVRLVRGPIP